MSVLDIIFGLAVFNTLALGWVLFSEFKNWAGKSLVLLFLSLAVVLAWAIIYKPWMLSFGLEHI